MNHVELNSSKFIYTLVTKFKYTDCPWPSSNTQVCLDFRVPLLSCNVTQDDRTKAACLLNFHSFSFVAGDKKVLC